MKTMKRLFGIVLMLMVSMVVKAQVVVAIGEFKGGTIVEKSQDGQKVTITVTPATDYYIAKSDIVVVPTVNPNPSTTRGDEEPPLAKPLTLEGDDPKDLSEERDYTFTVPEGLGAWVMEATFHSLVSGTLDGDITWELTGETEKTLTISGEGSAELGKAGVPWADRSAQITQVVFGKGIDGIGDGLLNGLTALTNVEIQNDKAPVSLGKDALPAVKGLTVDVAGNLYNEYLTLDAWQDVEITSTTGVEMKGVAFSENNNYDTYVFDEPLVKPSMLNVLAVTGVKDNSVIVEEIEDIIPANLPVLLLSKELKGDDFRTAKASDEGKTYKSILYVASKGGKTVDIGQVYLLYNDVFYFSQAGTIPEGGIYLQLPEEKESEPQKEPLTKTRSFLTIGNPADGTPTAIESSMVNGQCSMLRDQWYDLNGRRLNAAPTRSGLYIYNGKKVAVK